MCVQTFRLKLDVKRLNKAIGFPGPDLCSAELDVLEIEIEFVRVAFGPAEFPAVVRQRATEYECFQTIVPPYGEDLICMALSLLEPTTNGGPVDLGAGNAGDCKSSCVYYLCGSTPIWDVHTKAIGR